MAEVAEELLFIIHPQPLPEEYKQKEGVAEIVICMEKTARQGSSIPQTTFFTPVTLGGFKKTTGRLISIKLF